MRLEIKIGEFSERIALTVTGFVLFLLLTLFMTATANAAEVTAIVDRNVLSPDDSVVLTVNIESEDEIDVSAVNLPSIKDFQVLNQWSSQEARASFVSTPQGSKFKTVRTFHYNYSLQPKREGTLNIGGVEVKIKDNHGEKTFVTKGISLKVGRGLGAPSGQQQGRGRGGQRGGGFPPSGFDSEDEDDPFSQLLNRGMLGNQGSRTLPMNPDEAFFVQVETDKSDVYVNEQVTVSFYLYTRGQIRDLDTLKYPTLHGFWKEDIEIATHLNFSDEVVNGLPYKKALLASFALFPIKEGTSVIDSYTAKCSVLASNDPFGALRGKAYTFTKSSQPVKINVKPLPTVGRPADFSGAVGDFQVSARVDDRSVVAHQPFAFKIRFEGTGNAKLIDIPPFQPPEGLELYDTQKESKYFRNGTSYKEFSVMLIPRAEGEFTLPSVSASVFDTKQKKYVTKMTEPVRIRVSPGAGASPNADKSMSLSTSENSAQGAKGKGISEPTLKTEWQSKSKLSKSTEAILYVVMFSLIGIVLVWRARQEFGWGKRGRDLNRRVKGRMKRVQQLIEADDWRGVGVEVTNTVSYVLGEISGEGGANIELERLLQKVQPSIRHEIGEQLLKQMEVFQILSFAPEAAVGKLRERAELKKHVASISALLTKAIELQNVH
jgi:hypothetical protein